MNDFYNFFSFSAKNAIFRASELCQQFRNQYLEPEHILFSLLKLRSSGAVQVLHQLETNIPKFNYSVEAYLYEHAGNYEGNALFSQRTISLLDLAYREVKRLRHREIGTTHLLIALAQDRSTFMKELFDQQGLDARRVRETFLAHLKGQASESKASRHDPPLNEAIESSAGGPILAGVLSSFDPEARETVHLAVRLAALFELSEVSPLLILLALALETRGSVNRLLVGSGCDVPRLLEDLLRTLNAQRTETSPVAPGEESPLGRDVELPAELLADTRSLPLGEMLPGAPGPFSDWASGRLGGADAARLSSATAKVLASAFATALLAQALISHECLVLGLLNHGGEAVALLLGQSGCDPAKLKELASETAL